MPMIRRCPGIAQRNSAWWAARQRAVNPVMADSSPPVRRYMSTPDNVTVTRWVRHADVLPLLGSHLPLLHRRSRLGLGRQAIGFGPE